MTPIQKLILKNILEDENATVRGIEYPSHPQIEGGSNACLKVTTMFVVNEVSRTWVEWYAEDGYKVNGRELVEWYNDPTWTERRQAEVDSFHPSRGDYLAEP